MDECTGPLWVTSQGTGCQTLLVGAVVRHAVRAVLRQRGVRGRRRRVRLPARLDRLPLPHAVRALRSRWGDGS